MTIIKHIKYLFTITLIMVMCISTASAQQNHQVKEVLKKITQFYTSANHYQIDIVYNMHRGLSGNTITESYQGKMIKKGDFTKIEALGSKILHFSKARLIVDSNKKVITYNSLSGNTLNNTPVDVGAFLKYYDQSQIIDKGTILLCEMISTRKNFQLPYGKVILHIDKENYSVVKQELYFSNLIPFLNKEDNIQEQDYGRLIILLSHNLNTIPEVPKLKDYIKIETNNGLVLQDAYTQYRLIDQTENKNNQ